MTLLHSCKWDKDKLVELWIEDSERVCNEYGIVCPVKTSKEDDSSSLPSSLFLPFPLEEERRPPRVPPRFSSSSSSSNPSLPLPPFPARAFGGNMRLLDIIRPLLARRMEANGENNGENEEENNEEEEEDAEASSSNTRAAARRFVEQLDDVCFFLSYFY